MKIERVQYDGEGRWIDVVFDDGRKWRLFVGWLRFHIEYSSREKLEWTPEELS